MRVRSQLLAALVAGLLHTAAFAPSGAWWLQIMSLAWLAHLSWSASPRRAAALGAAFGTAWLGSGLWWLHISMHQFGHIPWLLAALAVLLLATLLSLYYAGALALAARLRRGGQPGWHALTWAACWLGAELARASLLSGFPWLASGYAHSTGLLAGWAPWIGVYGITALAAGAAAAFAALGRHSWQPAAVALLLVATGEFLPHEFTRSTGVMRVSLLQPNVAQDQKFDRERIATNLDRLAQLIEAARGQLVVTPESVVPLPVDYLEKDYVERLRRAAGRRPLLLGTFLGNEREGWVNSLLALGTVQPYQYGKRHLLPFGEFVPPGFRWFVELMRIPMEDQARGQHQQSLALLGQRLRPLICYEDLFGEDFVDSVVGEGAATILINASNLAWFGTLMVQDQHLQFSQMRALEFQRPVIRSTNTGATAVVDHRGRVTARMPPATAGLLEASVEGRRGDTPYALWLQRLGLAPLWAVVAACLAWAWLRGRRQRAAS